MLHSAVSSVATSPFNPRLRSSCPDQWEERLYLRSCSTSCQPSDNIDLICISKVLSIGSPLLAELNSRRNSLGNLNTRLCRDTEKTSACGVSIVEEGKSCSNFAHSKS